MLPSRLFFDDSFFKGEENIKCDVYEKDGKVCVEMEAPGYKKDDITISVDKGELTVTFEKNDEEEENKKSSSFISLINSCFKDTSEANPK